MATPDPGSFRDPTSQVLLEGDSVQRVLAGGGAEGWRRLESSGLANTLISSGRLVGTREVALDPSRHGNQWEVALDHERVPFVSYPYEWTFSMLKQAAVLQLEVLLEALASDLTLKDATPYNVQFRGAEPVFIDVGSFKVLETGEPWLAYRQFCRLFLFPLMLRAYRDVPFQPWLRGTLEGITAVELRRLLRARDLWRRPVLLNVVLQARAERRESDASESTREAMKEAGFRKELIEANARSLLRTVQRLGWRAGTTAWSGYAGEHPHVQADRAEKSRFVAGALSGRRHRLVWDLGANDGHFSKVAAEHAEYVVAVDGDEATVDALYRSLRSESSRSILPLVVDLADPSPSLGWAGTERPDLAGRGRPDAVLCLALLHHLVIGRNIPVERFVEWLAGLAADVVVEFADRDDPMVRRLMLNKRDEEVHDSYDLGALRKALAVHFDIAAETALPSGHRTLLHARFRR